MMAPFASAKVVGSKLMVDTFGWVVPEGQMMRKLVADAPVYVTFIDTALAVVSVINLIYGGTTPTASARDLLARLHPPDVGHQCCQRGLSRNLRTSVHRADGRDSAEGTASVMFATMVLRRVAAGSIYLPPDHPVAVEGFDSIAERRDSL